MGGYTTYGEFHDFYSVSPEKFGYHLLSHTYFRKVVYKELNEFIWLRMASHCGDEDESTDNIYAICVVGKLAMFRKIYIHVGHVSSCVIRNASAQIEITDLKFYVG
jgi:hypothetical protein